MKKVKKAGRKTLYIGKRRTHFTDMKYEVGTSRKDWDPESGFVTSLTVFCEDIFEEHVGKLKPGECRRLYVRIGR